MFNHIEHIVHIVQNGGFLMLTKIGIVFLNFLVSKSCFPGSWMEKDHRFIHEGIQISNIKRLLLYKSVFQNGYIIKLFACDVQLAMFPVGTCSHGRISFTV